jgi:predicted double-glycine peptidase
MIWIAVQLLGSAVLIAAGILAFRRSKRLATALAAAMLALILLKVFVGRVPSAEPRVFPWDWYPFVEGWWFLFPAMVLFGVGITHVRRSVWKRDGLLVGAGYLLIHCGVTAALAESPRDLTGVVNKEGICFQSTGYSCAPAAAAMILHRYGIPATENEMAKLCVTRGGGTRMSGTSDAGILRGLRHKLQDRGTAVITAPEYERIPVPSLVPILLNPRLSHCILVSAVESDQVRVIDPVYGRGTIARAQFERIWQKSAISLEVH